MNNQDIALTAEQHQQQQVDEMLDSLRATTAMASERLRGMFGPGVAVDEVAVLFKEDGDLLEFVRCAVRNEGYDLFNTAYDVVETFPIRSMYRVSYWFLSTPHGYRLELMTASPGSPLHDIILLRLGNGSAAGVHTSFKVANEVEYAVVNGTLMNNGYEIAQRCHSSYGRFAYWVRGDQERGDPVELYMKPRLNTRDVSDPTAYQEEEDDFDDTDPDTFTDRTVYTDADAAKDVEALGGHDA